MAQIEEEDAVVDIPAFDPGPAFSGDQGPVGALAEIAADIEIDLPPNIWPAISRRWKCTRSRSRSSIA
jgi:hypothetical protein